MMPRIAEIVLDANGRPALRITANPAILHRAYENIHTVDKNGNPAIRITCEDMSILGNKDAITVAAEDVAVAITTRDGSEEFESNVANVIQTIYNDLADLGDTVNTMQGDISTLKTGLSRYGVVLASFLPTPASDGTLNRVSVLGDIVLTGVKKIADSAMAHKFANNRGAGTFSAPDLVTVQSYGLYGTFSGCSGLTRAEMPALIELGSMACAGTFRECTALTSMSFPMLVFMNMQAFGVDEATYIFAGCDNLLEIHFRKDAEKYVPSMIGYADKWGAKNATIYFDLDNLTGLE